MSMNKASPFFLPQSVGPRRWGYICPDGSSALEPRFKWVDHDEWKGRDVFKTDDTDGRHALYDFNGNEILPPRDEDGLLSNGDWQFVRPDGKVAFPDRFDAVAPFEDGIAWCEAKGGRWGPFLREGLFLVPPIYDDVGWEVGPFMSGWKNGDELMNWFDKSGRIVVPADPSLF